MSFKTPLLCDRRVYSFRGKWKSPNNDLVENIYYFIKEPLTMIPTYVNGREEITETLTITVFGTKQFAKEDSITLQNGTTYKINQISPNEFESNILVRDMIKTRYESVDLVLQ